MLVKTFFQMRGKENFQFFDLKRRGKYKCFIKPGFYQVFYVLITKVEHKQVELFSKKSYSRISPYYRFKTVIYITITVSDET